MSSGQPQYQGVKFQNPFFFGMAAGILLNVVTKLSLKERASGRPLSYVKAALGMGFAMWCYDYWRRCQIERILYSESEARIYSNSYHLNRLRVGEED
jgi:hypothetical protein